jgi:hypothetical protein
MVFVATMLLSLIFCVRGVSAVTQEELVAQVNRDLDGYRQWLVDGAHQRIREDCLKHSSEIETVEKRVVGEAQARASERAQEAAGRVAVLERGAGDVRTQCALRAKFLNDDLKKRASVLKQHAEGFQERSVSARQMSEKLEYEFSQRVAGCTDSDSAGADLSEFVSDCRKSKMKSKTARQMNSLLKAKSDNLTLRIILKSLMRRQVGERKEEARRREEREKLRKDLAQQEEEEKMPAREAHDEAQVARVDEG